MKIPINIDHLDLSWIDTPPCPQLEVDLASLEHQLAKTPPVIHPVIISMFKMMAQRPEFGVN